MSVVLTTLGLLLVSSAGLGVGRVGLRGAVHPCAAAACSRVATRAAPGSVACADLRRAPSHRRASLLCSVDSTHAAFGPVVRAARAAIEECTGKGTESSGSGRIEWGTWLDADLRWAVTRALDDIVVTADGEAAWAQLTERFGALDAPLSLRIAGDLVNKRWDVLLHLLPAQSPEPPGRPGDVGRVVRPTTGTLTMLKPLLGTTLITKMRLNREDQLEPIGVSMEAVGLGYGSLGGGGAAENTTVILGGLHQHTTGRLGRAALLEVVLAPPHADAAENVPPLEACALLPLDTEPQLAALFARAGDAEAARGAGSKRAETAAESARRLTSASGGKGGSAGRGLSEQVGGLEAQLDAIVRRVLASRASPDAARMLGISHVRGILLSGPPGCGKTLLARELARQLGAREPQVVNGPEILSKFVGEAEANVRRLFAPAAEEFAAAGAASALHVVILDEMDAIARARGSSSGDTSGVRDSVVNQLLAQMDGVVAAPNVLVIGCTNRPELIDPALLRPGRLEVQLDVSLPDAAGRREILRIHTRAMRQNGALAEDARNLIDGLPTAAAAEGEGGGDGSRAPGSGCLAARTEYFSGAELAGLVRSAASFALARASLALREAGEGGDAAAAGAGAGASSLASDAVKVRATDFERALAEVTPSLGKRDAELLSRFGRHGLAPPSEAHAAAQRAIRRFLASATAASAAGSGAVHSLLLVGDGPGAGVTAAGAWATWLASTTGAVQFARLVSPLDLIGGAVGESGRCAALIDRFAEARAMGRAALLLDDVDCLLSGSGSGSVGAGSGVASVMAATLRGLLREPFAGPRSSAPAASAAASARLPSGATAATSPVLLVIGTCSDVSTARALGLTSLFGSTVLLPQLSTTEEAQAALDQSAALRLAPGEAGALAQSIGGLEHIGVKRGVKTVLALAESACALADAAALEGHSPASLGLPADASPAALRLEAMRILHGDWLRSYQL